MTNNNDINEVGVACRSLVRHLWVFDCNYRVYVDPETGVKSTGPIYKYGWVKHAVIGETRMSWLYGPEHRPTKIPKKGPHHGVAFSEEEVAQKCFVKDNAHKLGEQVRRASYAQLKEIERILYLPNAPVLAPAGENTQPTKPNV